MIDIITLITTTLGITIEHLFLFLTAMFCIVLAAIDLRLSALIFFFLTAIQFAIFYNLKMNYTLHLAAVFISIIVMALSLLISQKYKVFI
ncbi:MAG: hypothetical protein QXL82_03405 [Candidatus Aenigmatarchaeota archaeon]